MLNKIIVAIAGVSMLVIAGCAQNNQPPPPVTAGHYTAHQAHSDKLGR